MSIEKETIGMTSAASALNIEQEQRYRASAYALLAALLRATPDQAMLEHLTSLSDGAESRGDDLMLAMSGLAVSATHHNIVTIEEEFHDLFIGLGKGEVVPYASWYLTGFLMEQPLSDLRTDLANHGFVRSEEVTEPEDHAAALCEVVAMMIGDAVDQAVQIQFFQRHMASWLERFFEDLHAANSAMFYRAVARFGVAFIALEKQYFSMQS